MARVKRGTIAHKRRGHLLEHAKGFRWGRKSKFRLAKDAVYHAWEYAYQGRKNKKRNFRRLWQTQIGATVKEKGISYSKFISSLKKNKIEIDRKVLSFLAQKHPEIFEKIVERAKS